MTHKRATCDTSVLIAALAQWHPAHEAARRTVVARMQALPAQRVLECYSVLTRLPSPHRVTYDVVGVRYELS
jgi:hypothetical protein